MDVAIEYTLTVDGAVVDSSEGKAPLHYIHGSGQIIPGLEQALTGLRVGDRKEVTINPEQGYGVVDPSAVVEIPKAQLPTDVAPTVGMALRGQTPDGEGFAATIKELKAESVVLDLNHPLAGKTLHFNVTVADVKPAPAR
jgi:FKBP-type peptidyl-prolyl cis-trans isomerase SlyD